MEFELQIVFLMNGNYLSMKGILQRVQFWG